MPKLIIQDQLKLKQPRVIPFKYGVTPIEILTKTFKTLDPNKNKMHLNGALLLPSDRAMHAPLKDGEVLSVTQEVKGLFDKMPKMFKALHLFDPTFSITQWVDRKLFPNFDYEGNRGSANNTLSGQSNLIRAYSQKPVVCGSPVVFPDSIGESIEYYSDNKKYAESYLFVSHGVFSDGIVQAGDTNLLRFDGATATRYLPDEITKITTIQDYRVGNEVSEAAGQTLKGTNEGSDGTTYDCSESLTVATYAASTFTIYVTKNTNSDNLKASVDAGNAEFSVEYIRYAILEPQGAYESVVATGSGNISSMTLSGAEYTIVVNNFNGVKSENNDYEGPYYFTEKLDNTLGPFVNPAECEKMFFNIRFDRGLKSTVPFEIVVYELDSKGGAQTGTSEIFTVTYTEDTLTEVFRTFEIEIANGFSWYEWTIQRTNQSSEDTNAPDIAVLEKAYCIQELGDYDFINATMLKSIMTAEQTAGSGTVDNKINIVGGFSEMPSYDVNTGLITDDAPSRIAADALLFVWRDFYKLDTDLLNLDELYTIGNSLPESMKTFDYTFDDTSTSVGDVMDVILDVMRVQRYWDGKQVRFWRDEATSINGAILSRVDMAPESERSYSLSRSCFVTGQYDSVQVEYVDRSINKKAYIYRSIDGVGNIINEPGKNPLSKVMTGCQSEDNAINRAELEMRKILYQRWTLSDTFIDSHRFLEKGNVVLYNEVYEGGNAWGGEILDVSGNTARVRETLELEIGKNYQVFYTNSLGGVVGPLPVTTSTANSFTCSDLSEVYLMGFEGSQLGSRYYITEVNDTVKRRWRVVERTSSDYNVQLSMIGYDERIYEYDTM